MKPATRGIRAGSARMLGSALAVLVLLVGLPAFAAVPPDEPTTTTIVPTTTTAPPTTTTLPPTTTVPTDTTTTTAATTTTTTSSTTTPPPSSPPPGSPGSPPPSEPGLSGPPPRRPETTTPSSAQPPQEEVASTAPSPIFPGGYASFSQMEGSTPACSSPETGPESSGSGDRALIWWCPRNPFRVVSYPATDVAEGLRGIHLTTTAIELVDGGELVSSIPFDAGSEVHFEEVAAAIGDPGWVEEVEPGVFLLRAAFVQGPGTTLLITSPGVAEIRLASLPAVFWGGLEATGRFEGVRVTSWDVESGEPDDYEGEMRPFVIYQEASVLDVVESEMLHLGADIASGGYGVSWRLGGTTGTVTGSTFADNYFGLYTFEARDMVIRDSVFHRNIVYGVDPHDFSTGLVIEGNEAAENGRHGIIVSKWVTDSVIRDNHSHDNGANGIVLDKESGQNSIEGNLVEDNRGDGIALIGSGSSRVVDNDVIGNGTGIRVHGEESDDVELSSNRLSGNEIGIETYGGAESVRISDTSIEGSRIGMLLDAPDSTVESATVDAGERGIELRAPTEVTGLEVTGADLGVVVKAAESSLRDIDIDAADTGIRVSSGSSVTVDDAHVVAQEPIDGTLARASGVVVDVDSPFPLLGWLGIALIPLAIVLELIRRGSLRITTRRARNRLREILET